MSERVALKRDPQTDRATLQAVLEAAQAGDHSRAAELAAAALADGLEHPLLLNVAALGCEQRGRPDEALPLLERAVRIAPNDVPCRNALGLCLLQLERPAEALEQFNVLIRLSPDLAFAHTSRGNALLALGEISDADASFQRAVALDPNQGVALAGLAHIASSRGASVDARQWAEKALTLIPGYPKAVMSLALAELTERQLLKAEGRVRALLEDSRLTSLERACAEGLLGDVLDAEGSTAEAFACYSACNQQLQETYANRFATGTTALEYAQSMLRYFDRAQPDRWRSPPQLGSDSSGVRGHVFLVGFPRSGTTLLEVILEGHPNVASLEERELLIDSVQEFMQQPEDLERLARAGTATLEAARAAYWRRVAQLKVDVSGKVFVDKYPLNTLKLPLIARLFPQAKILYASRDPRDVVISCFRHRFAMSAPIYELLTIEGAARYYDAVMQVLIKLTGLFTLQIAPVRHEDLVTAFEREMKRICDFIGLTWDPAMGDFALRTKNRPVLTPSTAQLVRGLNTEGLGHWHRYQAQLAPVLPLLEPWIKRFYYSD